MTSLGNGNGQLMFAGVPLPLSTLEMDNWVEKNISVKDVLEFSGQTRPSPRLSGITFENFIESSCVRVGVLSWPPTASLFGMFHSVVSDVELPAIRLACFGNSQPFKSTAQTLVIDDGQNFIQTQMYFLAARPLTGMQLTSPTGQTLTNLYLLTLVDRRYIWSYLDITLQVNLGVTQWGDLFNQVSSVIGETILIDPILPIYLTPYGNGGGFGAYVPSGFNCQLENVCTILDAISFNVGQRIIVQLDGTVQSVNLSTSLTTRNNNSELSTEVIAGGVFNYDTIVP